LGHGVAEYLCDTYNGDVGNTGVVVGYDTRYDSHGLSQILATVLKAHGIKVYCLDRPAIAPFIAFFAAKFKCLMGLLVTGGDGDRSTSGLIAFNARGRIISKETSSAINRFMLDFIKSQHSIFDLSPLFDYSSKKVRFKPDNFTDVTIKSYIQDLEERFLINQRKVNKLCPKLLVTSMHGPASDYITKVFANFGFSNLSSGDI